ncbi:MAG: maleylpyruvate isomerase N-terminal domain-containing protein [Chloroflexota bacterium]|nr:maleylpyruvate isomerase N-terminal domain-containing protein [Chloroflexota bacterium]
MPHDLTSAREAFREAVGQFVETLERVPDDAWDKPGLGEWSIRELAAHVVRMLDRIPEYTAQHAPVDTESAAAYYLAAMSTPNVNAQIAERARESVALLGGDPAAAARAIGERTLAALDALDAEASAATPFGTVGIADYMATRILEIVVHTLDLACAAEVAVAPAPAALGATLRLLADIAVARGDGAALALALSGRAPLPDGYSALR